MAVLIVNTHQVHPGRRQDLLNNLAENKKNFERLGAKVRIWSSDLAGENTGRVSVALEFDDYAAWAKFRQAQGADSDWQALGARRRSDTNRPSTFVSSSSATEVVL